MELISQFLFLLSVLMFLIGYAKACIRWNRFSFNGPMPTNRWMWWAFWPFVISQL
jgi:hypothetical protein